MCLQSEDSCLAAGCRRVASAEMALLCLSSASRLAAQAGFLDIWEGFQGVHGLPRPGLSPGTLSVHCILLAKASHEASPASRDPGAVFHLKADSCGEG